MPKIADVAFDPEKACATRSAEVQRSDIQECTMVVDGDAAIAETQVSWKKGATFL